MAADGGDSDRVSHRAVIAFNDAINRRDLDSLRELMADGHAFIDSDDNVLAGKAEVLEAWKDFFSAFPDYRNDWSRVIRVGGTLIAVADRSARPSRYWRVRRSGRLGLWAPRLPSGASMKTRRRTDAGCLSARRATDQVSCARG